MVQEPLKRQTAKYVQRKVQGWLLACAKADSMLRDLGFTPARTGWFANTDRVPTLKELGVKSKRGVKRAPQKTRQLPIYDGESATEK